MCVFGELKTTHEDALKNLFIISWTRDWSTTDLMLEFAFGSENENRKSTPGARIIKNSSSF
jgi:hypothetical protein